MHQRKVIDQLHRGRRRQSRSIIAAGRRAGGQSQQGMETLPGGFRFRLPFPVNPAQVIAEQVVKKALPFRKAIPQFPLQGGLPSFQKG